jgi:integral membrane protein (TIGR01906 family)
VQRLVSGLIAVATAILIVTVAIAPFLTPQWIAFEQDRAEAQAWTGFSTADLRTATDSILSDLVIGPPDFDVSVAGAPVLEPRERAHMRDVRSVFIGLWIFAAISFGVAVIAAVWGRDRAAIWRATRRGAIGLGIAVVVLGVVAVFAFDALFEAFHEVFFPAGSYTFDPATDRLVQLFPFRFWDETSLAAGVLILILAGLTAVIAGRRAKRAAR